MSKKATKRNGGDGGPSNRESNQGDQTCEPPRFPIVGIGASAGGLEALKDLLHAMPVDTGMGFVIVTHQHPGHISMLPELLGESTEMRVRAAEDWMRVEPGEVYVTPPGKLLSIFNGVLRLEDTPDRPVSLMPIDYFLRSLATDQQECAICIILSGTGTDGTLGLEAIKGESGMTMVQEAGTAQYSGMPISAAATGMADFVLPTSAMPAQLVAYTAGPYLSPGASSTVAEEPLQKIFWLLRNRTGHDFSGYKTSTIGRRIERRMNLHQIVLPNLYLRFLHENPEEIDILFKELLISVTCFFRDAEAFQTLAQGPLKDLIASRPDQSFFRVWVPGCATGEEVYSIAILLREIMTETARNLEVQIFGTDLDSYAIESARVGRYSAGIANDVSPERLERNFIQENGHYRIRKEIREMAIFALQNVIKDAPFTKLDLICCRNLLIYLSPELQRRLLPVFHYSLRPNGLLFLGPSETIGSQNELFETVSGKWKLFRRKEAPGGLPDLPLGTPHQEPRSGNSPSAERVEIHRPNSRLLSQIDRMLLSRFCPAAVVVNDRGDIAHIQGRTGLYLELVEGHPRTNVLEMAREGLQLELSHALRQAAREEGEVVRDNVRVKTNGDFTNVMLTVARIREPETLRGLILITFRPAPEAAQASGRKRARRSEASVGRLEEMERELQYTKESLQITIEEFETSNEELKSANEELQSTNEELQSTNEELETSKEEMQSLNEELTTVNAEMHSKVEALAQANDDMQNLLNSTDIATLFLDSNLHIKRYTEQAKTLINLIPTDIGRPIGDLASNLDYDGLEADCRDAFRSLVSKESEVCSRQGDWFLMRIMPYRTSDNVIDGLVLTFVDLNGLKRAAREFDTLFEAVRQPLIVLGPDLRVVSCNPDYYRTFRTRREDTEGRVLGQLGEGQWSNPTLRTRLERLLPHGAPIENFPVEAEFSGVGRLQFRVYARPLERGGNRSGSLILLTLENVTGRPGT